MKVSELIKKTKPKITKIDVWDVARLSEMDKSKLIHQPTQLFEVQFKDGSTICTTSQIVYSSYYLKEFVNYPNAEPTVDCIFDEVQYKNSHHLKMLTDVFYTIYDAYPNMPVEEFWELTRQMYVTTNEIYNFVALELGKYVNTMSKKDVLEYTLHPQIVKAKQRCINGEISVDDLYAVCYKLLLSRDPLLVNNEIRKGVMAGVLDRRSVAQLVMRGSIKDINGETFKYPIQTGYSEGMTSAYDGIAESSSAKTAALMQEKPLQQSEYTNRGLQLNIGIINKVSGDDCGTEHYLKLVLRESDLKRCIGKYYLDEETNTLKMFRGDCTHLIGKEVKFRSITYCANKDKTTRCRKCIGHNAVIIPPNNNIGIFLTTPLIAKITQKMLSFKHLDQHTTPLTIPMTPQNRRVIKYKVGNKWLIELRKPTLKNGYYVLKLNTSEVIGFNQVNIVTNVNNLAPTRVSKVKSIEIHGYNQKDVHQTTYIIDTQVAGRGSSFATDFLRYIKKHKWRNSEDGVTTVDMRHWDYDNDFLCAPRCNNDVKTFQAEFKRYIYGKSDSANQDMNTKVNSMLDAKTPEQAITELMDMLSPPDSERKPQDISIDFNLTQVEVIVAAAMRKDPKNRDYRLATGDEDFKFVKLEESLKNGSSGSYYAWEHQAIMLSDPRTYMDKSVDPYYLDSFIK